MSDGEIQHVNKANPHPGPPRPTFTLISVINAQGLAGEAPTHHDERVAASCALSSRFLHKFPPVCLTPLSPCLLAFPRLHSVHTLAATKAIPFGILLLMGLSPTCYCRLRYSVLASFQIMYTY